MSGREERTWAAPRIQFCFLVFQQQLYCIVASGVLPSDETRPRRPSGLRNSPSPQLAHHWFLRAQTPSLVPVGASSRKPGRTFHEKSRPPEEQGTPCRMPLQAQYVTIKLNRYCSLLQACDPKENSHDRAQRGLTEQSCNLSLWKTSEHPGLDGLVRAGPPQRCSSSPESQPSCGREYCQAFRVGQGEKKKACCS